MVFVDLEKAYDSVPRKVVWDCLRKREVPEKYVRLVQDMYSDCLTRVRSSAGDSKGFQVRVGVHQGSALSPFLFATVMDVATESVRDLAPWSMLFADDIVLCAESKDAVASKLSSWMEALKAHGLKVNHAKRNTYHAFGEVTQETRVV